MADTKQARQFATYHYVLQGNVHAIAFVGLVGTIVQAWDDLVDRDKEVPPGEVSRAFQAALCELPCNPFYAEHFVELQPLIVAGINAWHDSNDLRDRGGQSDLARAYTLRDAMDEVVIAAARIVGGWDWMRKVSMLIRDNITHEDSFEEFVREEARDVG